MSREALPVDRLGRRHDERDEGPDRHRGQGSENDLLRQVTREGIGRVVVIEAERHPVQRREEGEQERHGPEPGDELPGDVLANDLRDQHDDHREERQEEKEVADEVGGVVLRSQLRVIPSPRLGDVHELVERGDLVAGHVRQVADRGLPHREARAFVHEPPVRPRGTRNRRGLDPFQVSGEPEGGEVLHRDRARLLLGRAGAGRVVFSDRLEGREVAERGDRDPLFFLDPGLEPPHLPAPDLGIPAVIGARLLEPELPLQIDLRFLLNAEAPREPVLADVPSPTRQELLRDGARFAPVDAELDRSLRKGAPEQRQGDRRARHDRGEAYQHESDVLPLESLHHALTPGSRFQVPGSR